MQWPPRTRVQRWSGSDRLAVLHQLSRAALRAGGLVNTGDVWLRNASGCDHAGCETCSFFAAKQAIRGVVMKVVTRAIKTIIENRTGERIPFSSPTLRTTNSTRPRVFIIR